MYSSKNIEDVSQQMVNELLVVQSTLLSASSTSKAPYCLQCTFLRSRIVRGAWTMVNIIRRSLTWL